MKVVEVAAAIVLSHDDGVNEKNKAAKSIKVLVSLRKKNAHQGGLWEFPGGKIEASETPEQALCRELKEELDVLAIKSNHLKTIKHSYPDKIVNIHFYLVTKHSGEPRSMEGQLFKWVSIEDLNSLKFPQANVDAITQLQKLYS